MADKTSLRFFENIPVRAVWDEESAKWWFCAMDIAEALTKSKNPRKYLNTIKTRKPQLSSICRQLKLKVKGGKTNAEIRAQKPKMQCKNCVWNIKVSYDCTVTFII